MTPLSNIMKKIRSKVKKRPTLKRHWKTSYLLRHPVYRTTAPLTLSNRLTFGLKRNKFFRLIMEFLFKEYLNTIDVTTIVYPYKPLNYINIDIIL